MIKIVDLEKCNGSLEEIKTAIEDEIREYMEVKSVSVSNDRKTAVIVYQENEDADFERAYEEMIENAAKNKLDINLPSSGQYM